MLYVIIAVAIIILLIFTLLFSKFKIYFEYKKYPDEKLYTKFSISFGFINLNRFADKLSKKAEDEVKKADKSDEDIIKKLRKASQTIKTVKNIYSKNRWHIREAIAVENLDFHVKFGLSDAAKTGIATGEVWTVLYIARAFIAQIGRLKKHYFEVCPVYTEEVFACQGSIKLGIRMISAIVLCTRLYLTYKNINNE